MSRFADLCVGIGFGMLLGVSLTLWVGRQRGPALPLPKSSHDDVWKQWEDGGLPSPNEGRVAPVYRGTPEILKMADWPGGRPSDAEIVRVATEPGVMRPAEDDPLEYGLSYHASERAAFAAGTMARVGKASVRPAGRFGGTFWRTDDPPAAGRKGEDIPAPGKPTGPRMPDVESLDGHPIDLPEFVFPDKAPRPDSRSPAPSSARRRRVEYPLDSGARPAPPRPLPPTSTDDP